MRFRLAIVVAVTTAVAAAAQVTPQFQPFGGGNKGGFYNSSVGVWADKLELELDSLRTAVTAGRISPFTKKAINDRVVVSMEIVEQLQRVVRGGGNREQIKIGYQKVEVALAELNRIVQTDVTAGPYVAQPLARVSYTNQQLYATLISGDAKPLPDQGRQVVARLAHALDEQADELRGVMDDQMGDGVNRQLDQAVRTFTRAARRTDRNLDDGGNLQQAKADFDTVTVAWSQFGGLLNRTPNVTPGVRLQAARVDGLYRKLGGVLASGGVVGGPGGLIPPPPGGGLVPPGFAFIPQKAAVIAVAAGDGGGPRVRVFHDLSTGAAFDFFAYDSTFRGGVRVAVADLNGDGIPDVITAPGPGMAALIRVFDGRDMSLMLEFNGIDPAKWTGGVNVAAADMGGTRKALVAVAPDVGGGPVVNVFDLAQGKLVGEFACFDERMRGGLRLAFGDTDGDGVPELIATQGPCDHPPVVRVFNLDRKIVAELTVFDPKWRGGVWVAAADVTGKGRAELIVGTDAGGPALVRMFDVAKKRSLGEWSPFPPGFRGGVRVAARDVDGDGVLDIITVPGPGLRDSPLRVFSGKTSRPIGNVPTFPGFEGGAFVGSK